MVFLVVYSIVPQTINQTTRLHEALTKQLPLFQNRQGRLALELFYQ